MRSHRLKLRVAGQEEKPNLVENTETTEQLTSQEIVPIVVEEKIEEPPHISTEASETKQNALKKPPFKKK